MTSVIVSFPAEGHQKTVVPIRPTVRGVCLGGIAASLLPRPGHRSPVDVAAGWRESLRDEGADAEMHCRQIAPRYWW
jgi:hypothetical protein